MDWFGNDVKENFVVMLTFCDGKEPQIVTALKEKDSIFDKIISHLKINWYYKFNKIKIWKKDIMIIKVNYLRRTIILMDLKIILWRLPWFVFQHRKK